MAELKIIITDPYGHTTRYRVVRPIKIKNNPFLERKLSFLLDYDKSLTKE